MRQNENKYPEEFLFYTNNEERKPTKKQIEKAVGMTADLSVFSNEDKEDLVLFVNGEEAAKAVLKMAPNQILGWWANPFLSTSLQTGFIVRVKDLTRIQVDYHSSEEPFRVRQMSVLSWRKELGLLPSRKKEALVRATSCFGLAEAMMANAVR